MRCLGLVCLYLHAPPPRGLMAGLFPAENAGGGNEGTLGIWGIIAENATTWWYCIFTKKIWLELHFGFD